MAQTELLIAQCQQVNIVFEIQIVLVFNFVLSNRKPAVIISIFYSLPLWCVFFLCAGKQVIHPGQIRAVQEEFSPSQERVQWAKELISAFDQHQKEGKVTLYTLL